MGRGLRVEEQVARCHQKIGLDWLDSMAQGIDLHELQLGIQDKIYYPHG